MATEIRSKIEEDVSEIKRYVGCMFWAFIGVPAVLVIGSVLFIVFSGAALSLR